MSVAEAENMDEREETFEFFIPEADPDQVAAERAKARELRATQWWKRKRSTGVCHYCGVRFHPSELTMDHLVPLIRGGRSVKANLVPACKECNSKKKHMLPFEWEEYLQNLRD